MTGAVDLTRIAVPSTDSRALSPVVVVVAALVLVLLVDAVVPGGRRQVRRLLDLIALLGLAGATGAVGWLAVAASRSGGSYRATLCVPGSGTQLPSCAYVSSALTLTLQGLIAVSALVCLLLALDGPGAADRTPHHVLLLAAVAGALALAGARDLVTLIVAFETASLPVIGLVALRPFPSWEHARS